MESSLTVKILKWSSEIGRKNAGKRLVMAGVNIDTAVRLLNGAYDSTPKKELAEAIEKAMKG